MNSDFLDRARRNVNLSEFEKVCLPVEHSVRDFCVPFERQYILRMMIRSPETNGFKIPSELDWLKTFIFELDEFQKTYELLNQFVYVTIRHGIVTTKGDGTWHVDGFSMKTTHVPEQDYVWSSDIPTEWADQSFNFPKEFDPLKHHVHWYFDDNIKQENVKTLKEKMVYLIDPYFVHRRPDAAFGTKRTFIRISFVPIEIEDGKCQQNPLLPVKIYKNDDIRTRLTRFAA